MLTSRYVQTMATLAGAAFSITLAGIATAQNDVSNLATGRPVQFLTPPNYPDTTDDADAAQLVDGQLASATPLWYAKDAVGWGGVDPVVLVVDLGEDQPIRSVGLHVGAGTSGVEWPSRIQIMMSVDGNSFSLVGDLMAMNRQRPPAEGYAAQWITANGLQTHGRYVKLICSPTNRGNGAYLIFDELRIERGRDAWLSLPLVEAQAPMQWSVSSSTDAWEEGIGVPEGEMPRKLRFIDGKERPDATPLFAAKRLQEGTRFNVRGEVGKPRRMTWRQSLPQPISTANCRYAVVTYRASGMRREYEPQPLIELRGVSEQGEADNRVMLLDINAARSDGRRHTLVKPLPEGFTLHEVQVSVRTESSEAQFDLESLELVETLPQILNADWDTTTSETSSGLQSIPLDPELNTTLRVWSQRQLDDFGILIDGATDLEAGPFVVAGVPFDIAEGPHNLAEMPESQRSNERVEFLGEMVDRRYLHPESRDDALSVDVDAAASEVFMLLALHANPVQRRGGHTQAALALDDIESLSVEMVYDEGPSTRAFPYSLADEAPLIPSRALGAYAVAADPTRRLNRVVLHNHRFGPNFALAALTVNIGGDRLVPELAEVAAPPTTKRLADPTPREASVQRSGDRVTLQNRWYTCELDLSRGFVIEAFTHQWAPDTNIALDATAGLRVRLGDAIYTGRSFQARIVDVSDRALQIELTSRHDELPLQLNISAAIDDSPNLTWTTIAVNTGSDAIAPEVSVPALAGLHLGELAQTRLFFPQYRAVDTGRHVSLRAPYGPEFTQQFMDVYNREAGIGLMIRSDNQEQRSAAFTMSKHDDGVATAVAFSAQYQPLRPGEAQTYPKISLIPHAGDWRTALDLHREWIASWYRPYRAQDKQYFIDAWDVMCYRPSTKISWQDTKTPAIINPDRTQWLIDETFAFELEHLGHIPDFVHFFNWTHNDQTNQNEYGIFGTDKAYAQVGGIDFFCDGIAEIQEKYDTPVSLYTLIDRVRASSLPNPELAQYAIENSWYQQPDNDASAGLRASGMVDGIYYMPRGDAQWLDFTLGDLVKMQRDTGCDMVYVDVFSHWSHLGSDNGISPRQADLLILNRLREELPAEVVLWSEYPPTDVASQKQDGALTYYFLDLNETFARPYDTTDRPDGLHRALPMNIGRYLLPRFKSIALPVYIEASNNPSQIDAIFLNGEAIQEDTWRLHTSRMRVKLNRAYEVKHEYNDCFNGSRPQPHVDTAVAGITANLFPGDGRNLWTVFNGRPSTYSGVVLKIPHSPGATYRDAWNDQEITPTIQDNVAHVSLTLDPQQPGCVVQTLKQ